MNHFTNCTAPTFAFPVTGTSLTNTITDAGGLLPVGEHDPWLIVGLVWVRRVLPPPETPGEKTGIIEV